jgi:ankyrin repeat protein
VSFSFNLQFATKKKSFDPSSPLHFDTYPKRRGTRNFGNEYEKLMCALLALEFSTSDIVEDFKMKTNSENCGNFDDVVLKVTFKEGQSQMFFLQLKHCESMKPITDKKLAAKSGDFSLLQYIESISKLEITENVSYILYTNSPTSIENDSEICLQIENWKNEDKKNEDEKNEKVVVRKLQNLNPKKLLLWSKKENTRNEKRKRKEKKKPETSPKPQAQEKETNVFQFNLEQNSVKDKDLNNCLKNFYFFADQTDTRGAQSLITDMLREKCEITDATYSSSFIQFMGTWYSGNFILTKYDVVAKLAELTLTPFMQTISAKKCTEKSKLLREAIMKFDMTIVRDTNEEVIVNIWDETASEDEISFTSLKYGLRPNGTEDLAATERSKVLWHLDKIPLIVKAEEGNEEQVKHAIKLLERVQKKKVVLLANAKREDFSGWKIFQNLSDLRKQDVYNDIVNRFEISLQCRLSICLKDLLEFDQNFCRTIETTELIKMTQEVMNIGRRQENAFENYISRSVSTISLDIMKLSEFCKETGSLLIICNVSQSCKKAIRQLGLHAMELDDYLKREGRTKFDVLLTSNNWPQVRFNDICEKIHRNVHLLQVFDNKSCISVISKEDIFSLKTMKSEEACVDEMEIFTYLDHPLNVICSPPGMGKSTLMSRLISNCPSSYWSVHIDLINYKAVFKKERGYDEILQHFLQDEKDPLVVKIRSKFLQNKRMYFFFDGLDEIYSDCLQIALDFIKYISSLGHRVWITSRENLEQTVSRSLNIFPIKIEELKEDQQKTYIHERLEKIYEKNKIEYITNKIYASVDIFNSRHLLGIPLQLFMITKNFRDNKELWKEPDQEIFVLPKMYKIFLHGKKMHQHRKLGVQEQVDLFDYYFDLYLEQYELPALKSCLDTTTFDKLKINLKKSQKFLERLKTGDQFQIVCRVTDDNQVIFNHQTYAEYFACEWLKKNLDKISQLQNDLFTEKNQNLKFIFDIMLAENSAVHLAVIYRHTDLVKNYLDKSEVKDEGGRSPLQLLCSYGVEHLPLSLIENNWWSLHPVKFISYKEFAENNIEGVSTQYREIFKMLLLHNELLNDHVFQSNYLDQAIRHHNLFAVETFLEKFGDSLNLESLFERHDIDTLVCYSLQMGYAHLLRAAIRKDSEALSVKIGICDLTLLHLAIMGIKTNNKYEKTLLEETVNVMTTLIECGLDVNAQCGCKTTALHLASELDDEAIVKFLLRRGANVNLTDHVGRNALHFALKNSEVNMTIVQLLINEDIDTKATDYTGKTPLHLCCRQGHSDALKMLLDRNLDVKVVTKEEINLLHTILAKGKSNEKMIRLLISKDVDVNGKDYGGRTALHYTCYYDILRKAPGWSGGDVNSINNYKRVNSDSIFSDTSKAKIISFLLENNASVNAKDSANRSVLHYAAFQRNYNCIKVLIEHGANVKAVCDSGKTVLHAAFEKVHSPDVEVIQLLLGHRVDANKRDNNQKTALDYAVTSTESDRVVHMLFDARAHDQLMSTNYVTFLHYAVYHGNCFAVELFIEGGIDLDKIDVDNAEYPLKFAVENQHLRSDLLLKMTKFIWDCKKKANFGRKRIVELLKEYFSNGYGSDSVSIFQYQL